MLLGDLIQFIKKHKESTKRTVFDITHLKDWMKWAINNKYAFISKNHKHDIDGVVVVCPIGKWLETPNMEQVIDSLSKKHTGDTDYFILDALTLSKESRVEIVNKILNKFKDIENNPETEIYAFVNERVIKFNKQTILTLKN